MWNLRNMSRDTVKIHHNDKAERRLTAGTGRLDFEQLKPLHHE